MNKQLTIGYVTEGTTDVRFLESIIQRTFENVALECQSQIEVLPVLNLEKSSGAFNDMLVEKAIEANSLGLMVLCVHADSDSSDNDEVIRNKINPAFSAIENFETHDEICKNLVSIIPVHMTESWMLADRNLIREELGTNKSDNDLGINRAPESIADPKEVIRNSISVAFSHLPKRRRYQLGIEDLYRPIGQKISLSNLQSLNSYRHFENNVRESLIKLNYLYR
ncbi:hypothetical protein BWI97_16175 [Siphonobacter sp. BAB-5405]|uniref:DUF4276 family protein n=1 Tax=Siphonobacter sp. BAB-5405 TaxID=1864825 RepID=UPI000C7FACA2|nr:DUF4276 family protein [Siphonobacter sp. BAB-5405]PMD94698.1 hypothetical protein BWI97_16175 [Siphonobacter sp. BAB-5405]